jgi:shikimate kinase
VASGKAVSRSITLVGFMAAGKSKIGRILAEQLRLRFVDTDAEVEAAKGMPVHEIFAKQGDAEFRRAEREAIARVLEGEPKIIAVGGGAFVDPGNRAMLNAGSVTVWLDPPFEVLLARLRRSDCRPLATGRSEEDLRGLWESRQQSYAEAHLRIQTSDDAPQRFADQIVERLG